MSALPISKETSPLVLHFGARLERLSDREFYEFCQLNPDLRLERAVGGDLIIMPPTGGESGRLNSVLNMRCGLWAEEDGTGVCCDSSTGFSLPNGAQRSPDLSWIKRERWEALSPAEREVFPPICPDFVVELRSRSDNLSTLQDKMREYIDSGAQLGWLIDPYSSEVYIYRPDADVEKLAAPEELSGEPELPGFRLDMKPFWK